MSNYKLAIKQNGIYQVINIDSLLDGKNDCSLKTLDLFTSQYQDEDELKDVLVKNMLLSHRALDYKLRIIYKYGKEIKTVSYGVMYAKDKDYLEFDVLLANIIDWTVNFNSDFLKVFLNHYYHVFSLGRYGSLKNYLEKIKNNENFSSKELERFIFSLENFCFAEVSKKGMIDYHSLREMAMLVRSIENNLRKENNLSRKRKKELEGQTSFL